MNKKSLFLFFTLLACTALSITETSSVQAAITKCYIFSTGQVCLNTTEISSPNGIFYFSNNASSLGDGNNYTTSITFSGALLTLARQGMSSLTATIPNNSILLDYANITHRPTDLANFTNSPGYLTSANITANNGSFNQTLTDTLYAPKTTTYNNITDLQSDVNSIGNWSSDQPHYLNSSTANSTYCLPNGTNCPIDRNNNVTSIGLTNSGNTINLQLNQSYGQTVLNASTTLSIIGDNGSWNQTLADTLYAPKSNTYNNITTLQNNLASLGNWSLDKAGIYTNISNARLNNVTVINFLQTGATLNLQLNQSYGQTVLNATIPLPFINVTNFAASGTNTAQLNLSDGRVLNATLSFTGGSGNASSNGIAGYLALFNATTTLLSNSALLQGTNSINSSLDINITGSLDVTNKTQTKKNLGTIQSMFLSNGAGGVGAGVTTYVGLAGGGYGTTESVKSILTTRDGTVGNLYVRTTGTQPATGNLTFTVRKNSVDQSIIVVVANGSAAGLYSDTTNTVSYVAGDLISIKAVNAAGASSTATSGLSMELRD